MEGKGAVCLGSVWERRRGGGAGRAQAGLPPCWARRCGDDSERMLGSFEALARPGGAAAPIIKRWRLAA